MRFAKLTISIAHWQYCRGFSNLRKLCDHSANVNSPTQQCTSFLNCQLSSDSKFKKFTSIRTTVVRFSTFNNSTMSAENVFKRLSNDVIPSNYNLTLEPDLEKFTFHGYEDIKIQVKKPTSIITINSVKIDVKEAKLKSTEQDLSKDAEISYDKDNETVSFIFPEDIQEGPAMLSVKFDGELNDVMKGFYRSKYFTPSGEERYCATTQFEATDARWAFPCWDEPAVKATFDITLVVPKDRVALSNMPIKSEETVADNADKLRIAFDTSPIMSTYLLAFIIGEYDYVEDTDSDGVRVRVYTPQGKKDQGKFALEVATKTLPFYHQYFNLPYPLPKIDLIAIADFAAGAMENWGLVTYRETMLLVDEKNSSSAAKQLVALVVGHELAHQWFGNLVTMEWWTHLWLNEGFATWIEYLCVDNLFPEYDIWTQFAIQDYCEALNIDAFKNSHPIEVPVGNPSEIDEIFDAISYCKGASVIRMLYEFIGDKDFRTGMNAYLTKHKYSNTFTEDLWEALGEASGKPINDIMSTWTKQMGFPVLSVSETVTGSTRELKISQQKFCADGKADSSNASWLVPVSICTSSSPDKTIHSFVLRNKETTISISDVNPEDWLKLNVGSVGFYRTQYTTEMLDKLIPAIKDKSLPPRDRLGLQNDIFAMARAGLTSTVDALKVAEAFVNEDNFTVWANLSSNLSSLSVMIQYTDYYPQYQAFILKLFSKKAREIGWDAKEGEGHLVTMLRSLMVSKLGNNGDKQTIVEAQKRFAAHCDGSSILPADLRAPVYTTVLSAGDETTYEQMIKLFHAADMQEEKVRVLRSLGAVKDSKLIAKVLEFALSKDVRHQDTVSVIAGATGSVEGREQSWKFLQDSWKELIARYSGGFLLSRLVKTTTENFCTQEKSDEVTAFFEKYKAPAAERNIQRSLENINLNLEQMERDGAQIKAFLQ